MSILVRRERSLCCALYASSFVSSLQSRLFRSCAILYNASNLLFLFGFIILRLTLLWSWLIKSQAKHSWPAKEFPMLVMFWHCLVWEWYYCQCSSAFKPLMCYLAIMQICNSQSDSSHELKGSWPSVKYYASEVVIGIVAVTQEPWPKLSLPLL